MAYQDRKYKRIDSKNLLNYSCLDRDGSEAVRGMGRTMDISRNGILLETHISVEAFDKISLTIGLEDELIDLIGQIVYSREEKNGKFRTGIEFKKSDIKAQETLKEFIKNLNS